MVGLTDLSYSTETTITMQTNDSNTDINKAKEVLMSNGLNEVRWYSSYSSYLYLFVFIILRQIIPAVNVLNIIIIINYHYYY